MKIRNKLLLKRPWLFPIYTVIGAAIGVFAAPPGFGIIIQIAVFIFVVAAVNVFFFWSLKRTLRDQKPPES